MLIDALYFSLKKSGALDEFWTSLDSGEDTQLAIASSARPFMVATQYTHDPKPLHVVVAGEENAQNFARNVAAYVGEDKVLHFPAREDYPFGKKLSDPSLVARRTQALYALQNNLPLIVVSSASALVRALPGQGALCSKPLVLMPGLDVSDPAVSVDSYVAQANDKAKKQQINPRLAPTELDPKLAHCLRLMREQEGVLSSFDDLARELEKRGYVHTGELDGPGTFCVRGGVIDIFPGNLSYPVRIDFFGDEIEEIRRIVPATGQCISDCPLLEIYPVQEYSLSPVLLAQIRNKLTGPSQSNPFLREALEKLETTTHAPSTDALIAYLDEPTACLGDYVGSQVTSIMIEPRSLIDDARHCYDDVLERAHGSKLSLDGLYWSPQDITFGAGQHVAYISIMQSGQGDVCNLPVKRTDVAGGKDKLYDKIQGLIANGYTIVFSVPHFRARQDMKLAFVDHYLPIAEVLDVCEDSPSRLRPGIVNIVDVEIPLGMIIPAAKLALISISDTQGAMALRSSKRIDITDMTFPYKPGDYVVHASHGVALFKDLVRQDLGGVMRDYLLLEYAAEDKLFVPVEQLDRVTRYVGPEGASPRLTRLNTADWSRALARASKATKKLAFDLVDVYTRRSAVQGYRYGQDSVWQKEMEEAFPYQETPDQLAAIADIKADMQSSRPMDRLVCGDVGFGKTEVALRAAFKATQDKKQVMVLCPTTILAQQHYIKFKERFEPFDVQVEVLSRFRTDEQIAQALKGFADGSVDVLVGTHRLLSRDVNPHDLGLVIIDEEQRFGVGHKEQMKNLRESIDVLTLSATPIPRTMQMSLSGVRDMSLILTAPDNRRPVEVHVGEWDPDIVAHAIRRELERSGQVYYVCNRVKSIIQAVSRVRAAAGEARIGIAHGQMTKEALEKVMENFVAGELDVLVATTIIESGIDNPHTNTLIIEDAQRLGLAQMYQLKGRVGRSSTQAYAYFMFPENIPLTEEATARLMALSEHKELGSGMRIAMRDLEIRGAGSILGAEQSGNMSAVGFDLFAQMLSQAVQDSRSGLDSGDFLPPALSDITVNVPSHTYLPEEYMPDADKRVLLYRKLASATTAEVVQELFEETKQAYPDMPQATLNLFARARIKALAFEAGISNISLVGGKLSIEPLELSRDFATSLRRFGIRYTAASKKLVIPQGFFKVEKNAQLLTELDQCLSLILEEDVAGFESFAKARVQAVPRRRRVHSLD